VHRIRTISSVFFEWHVALNGIILYFTGIVNFRTTALNKLSNFMTIRPSHCIFLSSLAVLFFCFGFLLSPERIDPPKKKNPLRVLCYNIHHAAPPSKPGTIDLDAIARVINAKQPDLVALQEVDVFTGRSGQYNQAEELGRRTGLTPYFFKAIDHDGGEYGVAILSRYPVTESNRYPLPSKEGTGGEPRVLGTVKVKLPNKQEIIFACTHLDAQRDSVNRRLQINAIIALLRESVHPIILAGDFNAAPGSGVITTLDDKFTRTCNPCDYTIPVTNPKKAIDFIAYMPAEKFAVRKHEVIPERYASDHLPVFVVLELR
jgi:endonuclease/exonuclease/phosphatase family metal-dependent hydrolase